MTSTTSNTTTISSTGPGGDGPRTTVSAQTNTSVKATDASDTTSSTSNTSTPPKSEPSTVTGTLESLGGANDVQIPTTLNLDTVVDLPAPVTSTGASANTEATSSGSNTVETSTPSTTQNTAEPTSHVETNTTSASAASPEAATTTAAATSPAPVAAADPTATSAPTAEPAAAEEQVAPVATPEIRRAVVYLLRMLASATVDIVVQLAAEIHAMFNFPWATQAVSAAQPLSALPTDRIVTLLKKILSHSSVPKVGSPTSADALASDFSVDEILSLTSMLQHAGPVLADIMRPGIAKATPIQKAITALAAVSLWALLYSALPGLGGLFAAGATGIRIGYRQAKAGIALRTTGLARFAKSGPIGIVRTGSLISVHSRTAGADQTTPRRLRLVA